MNNILKKLIYLVLILIVTTVVVEFIYRINYIRNIKKNEQIYKSVGYTSGLVSGFVEALFDENGKTPNKIEKLLYKNSIENGTPEQLALLPTTSTVINPESELFWPNHDIYFWWFAEEGAIRHESITHINNKGLISEKDYSLEKKLGIYRIVVIGDELTAATTASKSWPEFLGESGLTKENKKIEVLNFAWPDAGYIEFKKYGLSMPKNINLI